MKYSATDTQCGNGTWTVYETITIQGQPKEIHNVRDGDYQAY